MRIALALLEEGISQRRISRVVNIAQGPLSERLKQIRERGFHSLEIRARFAHRPRKAGAAPIRLDLVVR
jgi:hypothetical protein